MGKIHPSDVLFDVGAAIGYYSILAKRRRRDLEVHAFEPLGRHRRYLRDDLVLNGLARTTVVIHREALSRETGRAHFRAHHFGNSLAPGGPVTMLDLAKHAFRFVTRRGPSIVVISTLDTAAARLGKTVDLVKVDVQGFEREVLLGSLGAIAAGHIARWIVGTHSADLHGDCLAFLRQHRFRIVFEQPQVEHQTDGIVIAELAWMRTALCWCANPSGASETKRARAHSNILKNVGMSLIFTGVFTSTCSCRGNHQRLNSNRT